MKIKFCGIRRNADVDYCSVLRPDYMGLILSPGFRRTVLPERAASLVRKKQAGIQTVGVFVDEMPERIADIARTVGLDVIQLHGEEDAEAIYRIQTLTGLPVWKAVRVRRVEDVRQAELLGADLLVLEGYFSGQVGGTGKAADWSLLAQARPQHPFFLAGGLRPENLRQAVEIVQPDGVDVSSGIETDGVKDYEKMREIVKIIRGD